MLNCLTLASASTSFNTDIGEVLSRPIIDGHLAAGPALPAPEDLKKVGRSTSELSATSAVSLAETDVEESEIVIAAENITTLKRMPSVVKNQEEVYRKAPSAVGEEKIGEKEVVESAPKLVDDVISEDPNDESALDMDLSSLADNESVKSGAGGLVNVTRMTYTSFKEATLFTESLALSETMAAIAAAAA